MTDTALEGEQRPALTPAIGVDEVAAALGVSRKVVYNACRRGVLPHRRLGRRVVFSAAAIEEWLATNGLPLSGAGRRAGN